MIFRVSVFGTYQCRATFVLVSISQRPALDIERNRFAVVLRLLSARTFTLLYLRDQQPGYGGIYVKSICFFIYLCKAPLREKMARGMRVGVPILHFTIPIYY